MTNGDVMGRAGFFLHCHAPRRFEPQCDRCHSVYPAVPLDLLDWQIASRAMKVGGTRATYDHRTRDHRRFDQNGPGRTRQLCLAYPGQFVGSRQRNGELDQQYRRSSRRAGGPAIRYRIGAGAQRQQPGFRDSLSLAAHVTGQVSPGSQSPSGHFSQRRFVCLRQPEHWTRAENRRRMAILRFASDGVRQNPKSRTGG